MNKTTYYDSIHEFEDFISEEDQAYLLNILNNFSEQDWWDEEFKEISPNWYGKNIWQKENPVLQKAFQKMESLFSSLHYSVGFVSLSRYLPGDGMGEHADEIGNDAIRYGAVLYINGDFEGGEICYPEFDFCLKPKARSLVVHPGNLIHKVNTVQEGPARYIATGFVHGSDEKPAILK